MELRWKICLIFDFTEIEDQLEFKFKMSIIMIIHAYLYTYINTYTHFIVLSLLPKTTSNMWIYYSFYCVFYFQIFCLPNSINEDTPLCTVQYYLTVWETTASKMTKKLNQLLCETVKLVWPSAFWFGTFNYIILEQQHNKSAEVTYTIPTQVLFTNYVLTVTI